MLFINPERLLNCSKAIEEYTSKYDYLIIGIVLMYEVVEVYILPDLNTKSAVPVIDLF